MKLWMAILAGVLVVGACDDDDDDGTGPPDTQTITLATASEGVTGTAVITFDSGDENSIQVTLQGLEEGETYPGHIHQGSCETGGPVVEQLETIEADGSNESVTTDNVSDEFLRAGFFVQYHRQVGQTLPPVACGDIQ